VRRASRNGIHSGPFWAPGHTLGAAGPRVGRRGGARTRSSRQNGIEDSGGAREGATDGNSSGSFRWFKIRWMIAGSVMREQGDL